MKILAGIAISAGVVLAAGQAAVQTIDLPALDRSRIAFRLDAKPAIVVGSAQVPGAYFRRENDVVGLSDGRIALATPWGFTALHVVDPTGKVVRIGDFKRGVGVASLQDICAATDDRLLVLHDRTRFTFFSPSGDALSTGTRPDGATMLCPVIGQQAWIRTSVPSASLGAPTEQPHDPAVKSRRASVALRLLDLANGSRTVADLGEFDALDYYPVGPLPQMLGRDRAPVYGWGHTPFARDLRAAADRGRIHAGDGTTWEVRTWDSSGRLVRVLRVGGPLEPVTPELKAAFIDEYFAGNRADYRERSTTQNRFHDPSIYPPELPAFADLRVDRSGRLWVKRYPKPLETTQEWWVFSAEAEYLGRVDIPAAFIVDDIGDDYMAGSYLLRKAARPESDAIMDVSEYDVRLYRFRRS